GARAGVLGCVARRLPGWRGRWRAWAGFPGWGAGPRPAFGPPPCHEITLPPLGADDVADLLRQRFGDRLNRSSILRVHAACAGNPLFAVELGRAIADRDEPIAPDEPLPVPDRLLDLVVSRRAAG